MRRILEHWYNITSLLNVVAGSFMDDKALWTSVSEEQHLRYALGSKLLLLVAAGGIYLGAIFGTLGVILVYLGSTGNTDLKGFGQRVSTGSVGVASLFVAAITVILVIQRTLKSFDSTFKAGYVISLGCPQG